MGTLDGWFADTLPDMNTESPAVAKYLRQNAEWWIEETGALTRCASIPSPM